MDDEGGEDGPKDRRVRSGEYKVDDDASGAKPLDDRGACTPAGGVVEAGHIDAPYRVEPPRSLPEQIEPCGTFTSATVLARKTMLAQASDKRGRNGTLEIRVWPRPAVSRGETAS